MLTKSWPEISGDLTLLGKVEGGLSILPSPDPYEGDYTVTPKMEAQSLPTTNKTLSKDVLVEEIPVFQTENISGGFTVIIGG